MAGASAKPVVLGTALWGWGVEHALALQLLDRFAALGGGVVDTAVNYPINKRPEDFGLAAKWVAQWTRANPGAPVSVLVKLGAQDNMGGPDADLRPVHVLQVAAQSRAQFGDALGTLAVHWDKRDDADDIAATVHAFASLHAAGLQIGFSGVQRPELYLRAAPELADQWWIQVKENALACTDRQRYAPWFPQARYLAYGINMGGVKIGAGDAGSSLALRGITHPDALAERLAAFLASAHGLDPAPTSLNDLALCATWANPGLHGVIIGPRNVEQLESTLRFWQALGQRASAESIAAALASLNLWPGLASPHASA